MTDRTEPQLPNARDGDAPTGDEPLLPGRANWRRWLCVHLQAARTPDGGWDDAAFPEMIRLLLAYPDRRVRLHALRRLRQEPDRTVDRVAYVLWDKLEEPDLAQQSAILTVFLHRGSRKEVGVRRVLSGGFPDPVRWLAAGMLWSVSARAFVAALADDPDREVASRARSRLRLLDEPRR
jgi:hypothetical protein